MLGDRKHRGWGNRNRGNPPCRWVLGGRFTLEGQVGNMTEFQGKHTSSYLEFVFWIISPGIDLKAWNEDRVFQVNDSTLQRHPHKQSATSTNQYQQQPAPPAPLAIAPPEPPAPPAPPPTTAATKQMRNIATATSKISWTCFFPAWFVYQVLLCPITRRHFKPYMYNQLRPPVANPKKCWLSFPLSQEQWCTVSVTWTAPLFTLQRVQVGSMLWNLCPAAWEHCQDAARFAGEVLLASDSLKFSSWAILRIKAASTQKRFL